MGLFSFGGSSARSNSQSTSLDYGYNTSSSFSDSLAQSSARSQGTSSTRIAFEDLVADLYGNAQGATRRAAGMTPLFEGQAAQLFTGGTRFLEDLGGGAGEEYLTQRLGANPLVDEQIGGLREDLGALFRDELNPAIASAGVATGTLGGGRQGVAQGRAAEAVARQFTRGATDIRTRDLAMRDAAAGELMAGRTAARGTGLSALESLYGVARGGSLAELDPYQALAQIMGSPTVLSESREESLAQSEEIARAISQALGFSYGTSQSTSSSRARSLELGFL